MRSGPDIRYPGLGPRLPDPELTTGTGPAEPADALRPGLLLSLLIRPDGCIPWSTADGVPLETALTRWFG